MQELSKWVLRHLNIKNDSEFVIFLLWSIFVSTFLFALVID